MRLVALALGLLLLLTGCRAESPAGLLTVVDFAPQEAEVGDQLVVIGTGFPEGRKATVTFRGDLHRPGAEPERGVEIVAPAVGRSQTRIGLVMTEELQEKFCGKDLAHTTFRGDALAAFAPRSSGAPPVTGVVRDIVLDLAPPIADQKRLHEQREAGRRALKFMGLTVAEEQGRGGLEVGEAADGQRAQRAGVRAGDIIEAVDGVRVRSVADVTPSGRQRFAKLSVRRGKLRDPVEFSIDVQGLRPAAPSDLAGAAGLVGLLFVLLLLFPMPLRRLAAWIAQRLALRFSQRRGRRKREELARRFAKDGAPQAAASGLFGKVLPYLSFVLVSAAGTLVAFDKPWVAADLDLGLVVVATVALLTVFAMISGGARGRRRWSLWRGLGAAGRSVLLRIPFVVAIASVVIVHGSLRFSELVQAQGALPWHWNVFKNPVLFVAFVLAVVAVVPTCHPSRDALPAADLETNGKADAPSRMAPTVGRQSADGHSLLRRLAGRAAGNRCRALATVAWSAAVAVQGLAPHIGHRAAALGVAGSHGRARHDRLVALGSTCVGLGLRWQRRLGCVQTRPLACLRGAAVWLRAVCRCGARPTEPDPAGAPAISARRSSACESLALTAGALGAQ